MILVATGAHPRELPDAKPDGERILTWTQVYGLTELPQRLIVVGSGVTGAEFASAYDALGCEVVLVSSRDRVLPSEDADAAQVLEDVFTRRGMTVLSRSRAQSVERDGDQVTVTLTDGRTVTGSHCLLAVGSIPNTAGIGLEEAGVKLDQGGFIEVDRVSRTSARGVYAAGDCTGRAHARLGGCDAGPDRHVAHVGRCVSLRSTSRPSQRMCSPRRRSRLSAYLSSRSTQVRCRRG